MKNKERKKEISKQPTKEECIAFFKELTNLADARFVPYYKMAIEALDQEPKIGHWIETAEEYYKAINEKGGGVDEDTPYFIDDIACSECLAKFSVIDNKTERFIYCPNCGRKIEIEADKED